MFYARMCPNRFSHWSSLWLPAGVPLCQDLCWLWTCGHGWERPETLKDCNVFWAQYPNRNEKWKLQVWQVIFLHRNSDYHPWRRPLGGGVVAGLPHRRYHHAHICRSLLVPAQIAAHPCGQTRFQLLARANQVHHRLPKPGAQVQTGGASQPAADGPRFVSVLIKLQTGSSVCSLDQLFLCSGAVLQCISLVFPFFPRLCANSEESLWESSVHHLLVCDHPSVQLPHRDGHLQTQIHRATLRPVAVHCKPPHGWAELYLQVSNSWCWISLDDFSLLSVGILLRKLF